MYHFLSIIFFVSISIINLASGSDVLVYEVEHIATETINSDSDAARLEAEESAMRLRAEQEKFKKMKSKLEEYRKSAQAEISANEELIAKNERAISDLKLKIKSIKKQVHRIKDRRAKSEKNKKAVLGSLQFLEKEYQRLADQEEQEVKALEQSKKETINYKKYLDYTKLNLSELKADLSKIKSEVDSEEKGRGLSSINGSEKANTP